MVKSRKVIESTVVYSVVVVAIPPNGRHKGSRDVETLLKGGSRDHDGKLEYACSGVRLSTL